MSTPSYINIFGFHSAALLYQLQMYKCNVPSAMSIVTHYSHVSRHQQPGPADRPIIIVFLPIVCEHDDTQVERYISEVHTATCEK